MFLRDKITIRYTAPNVEDMLKNLQLDAKLLNITTDISSLISEEKRTPKKVYNNPAEANETALSRYLPNDIWLELFCYLDIKTIVCMTLACKKFADLANDDNVRARLYEAKDQNRFYKFFSPKLTSLMQPESAELVRRLERQQLPYQPPLAIIENAQQVYNDGPRGFVILK